MNWITKRILPKLIPTGFTRVLEVVVRQGHCFYSMWLVVVDLDENELLVARADDDHGTTFIGFSG